MPRPQFILRALLLAMLVVAAFFGGTRFERERRRRQDEAAAQGMQPLHVFYFEHVRDAMSELTTTGE